MIVCGVKTLALEGVVDESRRRRGYAKDSARVEAMLRWRDVQNWLLTRLKSGLGERPGGIERKLAPSCRRAGMEAEGGSGRRRRRGMSAVGYHRPKGRFLSNTMPPTNPAIKIDV
jgi:hypothetical protein